MGLEVVTSISGCRHGIVSQPFYQTPGYRHRIIRAVGLAAELEVAVLEDGHLYGTGTYIDT
jgi:hypothetical protein